MSNTPILRFPEFKGEWEEKKLDSLSLINPKPGDLPEVFSYIDLESVKNGVLLQEKIIKKEDAPSRAQRLLEEKDILFQTVRPYQRNNYFFNSKSPTVASTGYAQFRVNKNNYPSFLYQYLYTNNFVKNVLDRCSGTSFPAISTNDLLEICLHIPSLAEQQKIADFLSNVDSIITAETKILNTLQKKKKALMQKLFTRQLRFKSDDGTDFPAWEEKKLGECVDSFGDGIHGTPNYSDKGDYYFINGNNIEDGRIKITQDTKRITHEEYEKIKRCINKNTILISINGTIGKLALFNNEKIALGKSAGFITINNNVNKEFIFYALSTIDFKNFISNVSTGTTIKNLSPYSITEYKFKIPSYYEQQKIAACLSSMDSLIQNQQKVVTTWQQRKKALLQQMFI